MNLQAPANGVQQHDQGDDQHSDDGDGEAQVRWNGLVPVWHAQRRVVVSVPLVDVIVSACSQAAT